MYLFFDTETNGLPKSWEGKMADLDNWPRIIELAWLLTDAQGNHVDQNVLLIQPDGWVIPEDKFWKDHNFTTEGNMIGGVPVREALAQFIGQLERSEFLVSHNMIFDYNIVGSEMLRAQMKGKRLTRICTMESSCEFCAIPFRGQKWLSKGGKFKWPKLEELHDKLFHQPIENAHSALGDVLTLKKCFFKLVEMGVINPVHPPATPAK